MATEREIKFKISAEADGAERIQKLADEINALAKSGGDASPEFKKLSAELDAIANQSTLITQFAEVKNKTLEVKAAITDAAEATAKSAIALKERTQELGVSARAEKISSDAVKAGSTAVNNANIAIRQAKAEIAAYNAAIATSGKANDEQTKGLAAANVELKRYKSELASAKSELDNVLPAQQKNAEALKLAQIELNKTSTAFDKNQASSVALKTEYRQSEAALQSIRDKMTAAGVSAGELSTEYVKIAENVKKVANEFAAEKNALENKLAVQKATTDAIHASDEAYRQRVATLKADAQVETQIIALAKSQNQVSLETERNTLAVAKAKKDEKAVSESLANIRALEVNQTKLTAQGLRAEASAEDVLINAKRDHLTATNRGTSATDAQIVAERLATNTKRELANATELAAQRQHTFATSSEKSGGALSSLGGFARSALLPLQGVIAAFAGATEFVRVNVELENIGRTFRSITGSSAGAAKEMQFVKETSNKLGLELVSTAKAYAQFSAATKGSSLEGEQTRKIFESVAHAMSVAGRSSAETEGALNALGQMVSKNVVQMEELRGQLGDRLPGAMKIAADSAGLTTAQLIKMVENGDVLAEDLLPKLAVGLDNAFKDSADNVSTTSQEFNRLRNAISETFTTIGESQVLKVLITSVAGLGTIITGFVATTGLVLSGLGATIGYTSTVLIDFFKFLTFQDGWSTFKTNVVDASDRLGTFFVESINKAADSINLFKNLLPSFGDDVTRTSGATDALGVSTLKTGEAAAKSKNDWLALIGTYAESRASLEKFAEVSEKHVASIKSEGDALIQLATLQGDESRIKLVAIETAKANQVAMQKESLAKAALLDTLQRQLAAEKEIEANAEVQSKDHLKKIEELTQLVAKRKEESEKALAQAEASKLLTLQATIEARVLRDNSDRVAELGAEYQSLQVKVVNLREEKKRGVDVSEKLTATEKELATASRLLADATSDLVEKLKAASDVKRGENDLAQLTVKLAIEERRTALDLAKSKGDEAGARRINNDIKRLEAELTRLQSALLRAEAEATLEIVKAKREEITARRELTKAEELGFKVQELGAQAKVKQSQIQDEITKRLLQSSGATDTLTSSTQRLTGATSDASGGMGAAASSAGNLTSSYNNAATAANNLANAQTRITANGANGPGGRDKTVTKSDGTTEVLRESGTNGKFTNKDGVIVNADGSPSGTSSNGSAAGAGYNDRVWDVLQNINSGRQNSYSADDKALAETQLEVAKTNLEIYNKSPPGAFSLDGARSVEAMLRLSQSFYEQTHGSSLGGVTSDQGTGPSGGLRQFTVNINLGAKQTAVNVASENDAQALLKLFGQLGVDKSRAN